MTFKIWLEKTWKLLCSLKLTIVLASTATLLTMGGSLAIQFNPQVYGAIEDVVLGRWLAEIGSRNVASSWWLFLTAAAILALGLNTLCCFLDWLRRIHLRWRKTGEYLIHLGFVLLVSAFLWGSLAGARLPENRIFVGQTLDLGSLAAGYALRLDAFEPIFNQQNRPVDMLSSVTLLRQGQPLAQHRVRTNSPLARDGLVIFPLSFGRQADGFRFLLKGQPVSLQQGTVLPLANGGRLRSIRFLPDAAQIGGRVVPRNEELGDPAFELELVLPGSDPWRGWYFLRQGVPAALVQGGILLQPQEPLFAVYSILGINHDPGAGLAMVAGGLIGIGVLLALGSFYAKRRRGDRPDIY